MLRRGRSGAYTSAVAEWRFPDESSHIYSCRSRVTFAASAPLQLWPEDKDHVMTAKAPSGEDRLKEQHNIGVSDTTFKVLTKETGGNLFVMERNRNRC
jgi:hypothetical protein